MIIIHPATYINVLVLARGKKVRGSPKSVGFILGGTWTYGLHLTAMHPIVIELR